MHIYNSELIHVETNPYTFELLKSKGLEIIDICPQFKSDWWATEDFISHPKIKDDMLVEKSVDELKIEGVIPLVDGEVIANGILEIIPKPNGYKIEWVNFEWKETATEEEISEIEFNKSVDFYNAELEFASKATAELGCEIITVEEYQPVKDYMKAIDPYNKPISRAVSLKSITRPSIFNKYK